MELDGVSVVVAGDGVGEGVTGVCEGLLEPNRPLDGAAWGPGTALEGLGVADEVGAAVDDSEPRPKEFKTSPTIPSEGVAEGVGTLTGTVELDGPSEPSKPPKNPPRRPEGVGVDELTLKDPEGR